MNWLFMDYLKTYTDTMIHYLLENYRIIFKMEFIQETKNHLIITIWLLNNKKIRNNNIKKIKNKAFKN